MSDLCSDVANALYWDFALPRYRLTVEADHGLIVLRGIVEWPYQRSCAEATARRIPGVMGVKNEITVQSAQEFGTRARLDLNDASSSEAA